MPPTAEIIRRNTLPAIATAGVAFGGGLAVAESVAADSLAQPTAITRDIGAVPAQRSFTPPTTSNKALANIELSMLPSENARLSFSTMRNVGNLASLGFSSSTRTRSSAGVYDITDKFAKSKFIKYSKASTGIPLALHKSGGNREDADGIHAYIVPGSNGVNYFKFRYPKGMHVKFIGQYVALNNGKVKFPNLTKRTKNSKYIGGYYKGTGGNDITVPTAISGVSFFFNVQKTK